jgi:hypothetical protein
MLLGGDADGPEASYFLNIAGMEKTSFRSVQSLLNRRFHGNMCGEFIVRSSIHPMKFPSEKKKTAHVHHVHPIFPESFQKFPVRKTPKKNEKKNEKCPVRKGSQVLGPPGAVLSFCFISSVAFWATCKFASKLVLGVPSGL